MVVPEFPEKTVAIQKHLREVGITAETFNCVSAVESGLETIHPYERDAPGSGWNIGPKSVALNVSFQMFWQAASYMPDDYFLFLEWDVKFQPDWFKRTEQALRDVPPDFDILCLGHCCCKERPKTQIKGEVWEVKWPMCNHAQIFAKKSLPTLLRTQRKIYAPWDISLLLHTYPLLKVYSVLPRVADQFDTELPE